MSLCSSKKAPSDCEAQCPDCGVTLSRLADMNRHRKTRHPDGTETKYVGGTISTPPKANDLSIGSPARGSAVGT